MTRSGKAFIRDQIGRLHVRLMNRLTTPPRVWHQGAFITPVRRATIAMLDSWSTEIAGRVLDVGVGRWTYPRQLLAGRCEYVAADCFADPNIDVVCDLQALSESFPEGAFDWVICTNVLEHLPRPWLAVRQLHLVLKPGGKLLLDTPFNYHLHGRGYGDYWRMSAQALDLLLREEAGFRDVRIHAIGPAKFPFSHTVVAVK